MRTMLSVNYAYRPPVLENYVNNVSGILNGPTNIELTFVGLSRRKNWKYARKGICSLRYLHFSLWIAINEKSL